MPSMAPPLRTLRRFWLVLLAILAVSGTARVASAQPADTRGGRALSPAEEKARGDEAMVALRYEDALAHYQRAYAESQSPALLYNMGRAHEGLGDFPAALDSLERFAEEAPAELKARVPKLEELLADVRKRVSTIVFTAPEGAEIRLGGRVIGTAKAGQNTLRVNAGPKTFSLVHEDYFPLEKKVALPPGKVESVDATMASRKAEGLLKVDSDVVGARVSVDGKDIGVVPAEVGVRPGLHRIALRREGYEPAETSVVVSAGETKPIRVPMARRETIAGKWWFWTAIGVAVVGGSVATYVALTTERDPTMGTIPPGRVRAELRF
jgi:hypothetical protein